MILTSLKDLAVREGLLENADYEPKPVRWGICIGDKGEFLGLRDTLTAAGPKKKPQPVYLLIPRRFGRTLNDLADFLVDKSEYVLGVEPDGKRRPEALSRRQTLFYDRICLASTITGLPSLRATVLFLSNPKSIARCVADLRARSYASNDLIAFVHHGKWVHDDETLKDYFPSIRTPEEGDTVQCLVCGNHRRPVEKHPALQLPGGTTSGVALVSFNTPASESYGWERNANAPICLPCADASSSAITRSLKDGYLGPGGEALHRRSVRLSADTSALYWPDAPGNAVAHFASLFNEPKPEAVRDILLSMNQGSTPPRAGSRFHCLVLSGGQGRATVRGYQSGSLAAVERNVRDWFRLTAVEDRPVPLAWLLRSLAVRQKDESLPPALVTEIFLGILFRHKLSRRVLHAALLRCRSEQKVTRERAILLAACLPRATEGGQEDWRMSLDPRRRETAYLLGRLLALVERLQREAKGSRSNGASRHYVTASTRPEAGFPALLRQAQQYLQTLNPEIASQRNREMDEVINGIAGFPASLTTEQQAAFALGYYHQREYRPPVYRQENQL